MFGDIFVCVTCLCWTL